MRTWLFIPLLLLFSCSSEPDGNSVTKQTKRQYLAKLEPVDNSYGEAKSFDLFLVNFNSDCAFQKTRVQFPLAVVTALDYDGKEYDTSALDLEEYECVRLTSPRSNVVEGTVTLKYDKKPMQTIVTLGVEDTGVHIEWFFTLKNKEWYLTKILDEST